VSSGRPRSSSRETIAEAACELFLERGYRRISVADIARRAGVSRSTFFNYFDSKADIFWGGLDERIAVLESALAAGAPVRAAMTAVGEGFAPDSLALAFENADAMGLAEDFVRDAAWRRARISAAVAARLRAGGTDGLTAEIAGASHGGAVLAAIAAWARAGAGRASLPDVLARALDTAGTTVTASGPPAPSGAVRQLRVVVRADDVDAALAFYRDELGMPEQESFEGDGGARVAILGAGRATLELSNPAQVALIDRVETDGDAASDPVRIALEVDDAAAVTERLSAAGARIEATPRRTPWRSLNARLRAPAGLQVTLFEELGEP